MSTFLYLVTVETEHQSDASQVMIERLNHDERLGFDYTVDWAPYARLHVDDDGKITDRPMLLELMSAYSEDHWAAGWLHDLDRILHAQGGIWEILGRTLGWPLGYRADQGWVSWDEATRHYLGRD